MSNNEHLAQLQGHLQREIQSAYAAAKKPLSTEDVASIVSHVIKSIDDVPNADLKFYTELEELAIFIRKAKQDIAAIQPKEISTNYIPTATDELDAVVGATEEATNKIMDVCDEMSVIAETCSPDIKDRLVGCTTKIFEACNFQDITGQRITKVVETLKHIDIKIEGIIKAMGDELHRGEGGGHITHHVHAADPDKALLNGPQLPQKAASQEDIDRLLSGT